jgi:hypothetical protein
MSAFVVGNETINRVITHLATARNLDHIRKTILDETGADLVTGEGRAKLGAAMLQLNCSAVDARYGDGESQTFRDDMTYGFRLEMTNAVQAYKSLQCWLYQCAEGEIPESSLLYATMERVKNDLACSIVEAMPAYDKARWDF